jgi:hypothetical protein
VLSLTKQATPQLRLFHLYVERGNDQMNQITDVYAIFESKGSRGKGSTFRG